MKKELKAKHIRIQGADAFRILAPVFKAKLVVDQALRPINKGIKTAIDYEIHHLVDAHRLGPTVELMARKLVPEEARA